MKKVLLPLEPPPSDVVFLEHVVPYKVYIAISKTAREPQMWILRYVSNPDPEVSGWIFNYVDSINTGMYGYFATPKFAIHDAITRNPVLKVEVFEFNDYIEAAKFIVENAPKSY